MLHAITVSEFVCTHGKYITGQAMKIEFYKSAV